MLFRSLPYILLLHNLWYYWGKITLPKPGQVSELWYASIATRPYEIYNGHFFLFAFFEFVAVAALFSDLIIRWDEHGPKRNWKFVSAASLLLLFIVKCGIRLLEAYMLQS